MKIAFFGTGNFSKNILEGILNNGNIEVGLIVSQPDKPVGRKKIITATPIKLLAIKQNIEILQPIKLKNNIDFFNQLKGFDFIVVVAYGKIVPSEVLNAPKYGCINLHGSILPKYRGASPIQESIKNGDIETGLTVMYMSEGMDEGDILKIKKINISQLDKTENIFKKFEEIGPNLLIDTLQLIMDGKIKGQQQNEINATYCSKISKKNGEINFKKNTGLEIFNKYKAYYNWPGIYTYYNNKKLNLEKVTFEKGDFTNNKLLNYGQTLLLSDGKNREIGIICKGGLLKLKQVKLEGKKSMDILSFINGNKEFLEYNF